MADAKLTALTAASALAGADLFYVSQSAASRKATGTQLLALVGTAYVPLTGGTMTGALTLPAGAVGTPSLMFTGAGATTGIYSAGSNEISFAVGGARVAYINAGNLLSTGVISASGGLNAAGGNFLISSNTGALAMGTSYDVWLYRDAAGVFAQRNGTNAQTLRVYSTYTDAANFERLSLSTTAGTSVNITAETLGTGADNLDIVLTPAGTGVTRTTSPLTIASGTLTASAPALNITQTWNGAGVAFSAAVINVTNTASNGLGPLLDLQVAGTSVMRGRVDGTFIVTSAQDLNAQTGFNSGGFRVRNSNTYGFSSDASYVGTLDVILARDAAATLAQRNGTNAQTLRVYGTYTDSSNYERLSLSTTAGSSVNIAAETLGTGADNLDIVLTPAGTGKVGIGGAPSWKLSVISSTTTCDLAVKDSVGALILTTSSGAAFLTTNTASPIIFRTSSTERMRLGENGLLSFGDVTASYPALKRSATALEFRLADDSGYADAAVRNLLVNPVAFASLVAAATAGNGARSYINNCSHSTFGTAADGGGAISVPVWSNGSSWLVG